MLILKFQPGWADEYSDYPWSAFISDAGEIGKRKSLATLTSKKSAAPAKARSVEADGAASHQEQLDRLKGEVECLRQQLQHAQRMAAVGTMTAMVAHEFNNILTPIISYAQLAKKNPLLADKAIARAHDGGQRASHICKAILGLSRKGDNQAEEVAVGELVEETLAAMAREPSKDGIDMLVSVPADVKLKTHRVELQQVLLNLLINARWAVTAGSGPRRIEIQASRRKTHLAVSVTDSGIGISPENLGRIFDPFFTTRQGQDANSRGSGLGLSICRDIITGLGGSISVQSTPGAGSTFTILLPA